MVKASKSGSSSRYDRTGYQSKGRSNNLFGRDRSTRRTTNLTEWRRSISQQDIHNEMRLFLGDDCNGVQREHNKKLNNGLPILHKVPPKRDYGRYFCIMAEKGGTSHGGLTEKLSPFFHAKKQEVNAYGR